MKERGQDSENMEAWRRTLPELEPGPLRRYHSLLLMVQSLKEVPEVGTQTLEEGVLLREREW